MTRELDGTPVAPLEPDDLIARAEIGDVLQRYVRGIDRVDLDLVQSCFHPDGYDDHNEFQGTPSEFIAWLSGRLGRHAATMHVLSAPLVRRTARDVAQTDTYCITYQTSPLTDNGDRTFTVAGLRYLDRFERRDGEWRIAHRRVAADFRVEFPAGPAGGPPFPADWRAGRRDRTDPSYTDVGPAPT